MLIYQIPGRDTIELNYLVLDFNGTVAIDGQLIEGVKERLIALSKHIKLYIATADTHGNVRQACQDIPVQIHTFKSQAAAKEKLKLISQLGQDRCVCMGNGYNDLLMIQAAMLSIAVMEEEGLYSQCLLHADLVVKSILDGLDLLLKEDRLRASLRA